ncbi:ABC-2 type transport system ATP-binding protein [Pseudoxanthomonas sp. CF385]|uniref:ABC transporter ATP-binding protein n=1 Tax=Pseudoxanthomonas sp. CF385 TaxID=1881042 RepID=UPI0008908AF4|nr:ABC transporter ATP-binding protein [Pseudoxanthomonas sp. CF385]SDQ83181.1 ABC-2 type transport system ATP-binding protein [Pseudoxanthomonas sp. CF385]
MTAALALSGVTKRYDSFALQDITLTMPAGQIMGLVGVNGAGKTTLLRILSGLARADSGTVDVLGYAMPAQQVSVKKELGFASEDMRLYKSQTLRWHMDFIRAIYPGWDEAYAADLLRRFDLRPEQTLAGFSHGQRVKALLLLNFARRPKLLLLDEPTTGLDPVARDEVLQALADILRDDARSVLFSSHNTRDIEQLADTISFVHQGRLLASKDKESFLDDWRRIICQGTWPADEHAWPEIAMTRQNGSLLELRVRQFNDGLLSRLQAQGLEIRSAEAMSLEDIFVTTVRAGGAA